MTGRGLGWAAAGRELLSRIDLLNFINVSLWRTSAWSAGDSTSGIPIRYPHAGPGDDSTFIPAGDAVFKDL